MKINVDDLQELPSHRLSLEFNEELDVTDAVKPVVGELVVTFGATGMRLVGNVKTLLKLSCQACLRPYFQPLSVDVEELFVPTGSMEAEFEKGAPRDRELHGDDFYEELPADGIVDISDVVYQAVTLASPVFSRCGEECPGPPKPEASGTGGLSGGNSASGKDERPIDPRWKNLKSLFPNEE
ncbi:MAG: DUF177 domain-containing protein [Cyanobacteria bacterium SZAS LIN-2]|nr:DUF177 domain-containing protein [Cyanobacteria bacterium SZAS LIN-3]MBS1994890.1 DUF177 domain-containing protein [Cyanobacteria bacterium SZAS LIN-2]MBS2009442.1 DUF177 domain-containing protein [Cyanobacteria bacterium SZAS TMP-1]